MKICCIADIHIGVKAYSKVDPVTHFSYREIETLNNFKKVIDICIKDNIEVLLIAGDIYNTSIVSPMLQDEVNKILNYAAANLKVLILDGNHDLKKLDTAVSNLKPLDTFNIKNVIHTKDWLDTELNIKDETVRFIFLPTYTTDEEIGQLLDEHLPKKNKYKNPIIVIGHFTTQGASLNDWLIAENEGNININHFVGRNINFVVLGHLHRPQILRKAKPFIFYTGSLQRTDFNEEDQEKGYWIIDTDDNSHEFFPLDMQKFYTINVNIEDNGISTLQQIKNNIDINRVKDAICRVIITTTEDLKLNSNDEKELMKYLQSLDATNVLAVSQKIIDTERMRNVDINETITIDKSLELFYKGKPREKERIKLGQEIINMYHKSLEE